MKITFQGNFEDLGYWLTWLLKNLLHKFFKYTSGQVSSASLCESEPNSHYHNPG